VALAAALGVDATLGRASVAWFAEAMVADPDADEARVIETVLTQSNT